MIYDRNTGHTKTETSIILDLKKQQQKVHQDSGMHLYHNNSMKENMHLLGMLAEVLMLLANKLLIARLPTANAICCSETRSHLPKC